MKAVGWMITGCLLSCVLVGVVCSPEVQLEILLGMIMPLLVAGSSLVLAERAYQRDPSSLTTFMLKAFVGKTVVIGIYVVVVMAVLALEAAPFIVSFTAYFITLHLVEALCLRRLFEAAAAQ